MKHMIIVALSAWTQMGPEGTVENNTPCLTRADVQISNPTTLLSDLEPRQVASLREAIPEINDSVTSITALTFPPEDPNSRWVWIAGFDAKGCKLGSGRLNPSQFDAIVGTKT